MRSHRAIGVALVVALVSNLVALVGVISMVSAQPGVADPTTCTGNQPCAEYLIVVNKDGLRCAIYQPGGPNSARVWCEDVETGRAGPAAGGS